MANHVSPNSVFTAFILLPTRFWPRIDRELPFLAIALLIIYDVVGNRNETTCGSSHKTTLAYGGTTGGLNHVFGTGITREVSVEAFTQRVETRTISMQVV